MILLALILVVLVAVFVAGIRIARRGGRGPLVRGVLLAAVSVAVGGWLVANWTP
jgi:hypothetical protein